MLYIEYDCYAMYFNALFLKRTALISSCCKDKIFMVEKCHMDKHLIRMCFFLSRMDST